MAHGLSTGSWSIPGAYYFLSEAQPFVTVSLNQVSNLTIDFQGADLYFAAVNYGLVFSACSNLIVENFTIDRLQPGYTQLRVTSVDPSLRQIKLHGAARLAEPDGARRPAQQSRRRISEPRANRTSSSFATAGCGTTSPRCRCSNPSTMTTWSLDPATSSRARSSLPSARATLPCCASGSASMRSWPTAPPARSVISGSDPGMEGIDFDGTLLIIRGGARLRHAETRHRSPGQHPCRRDYGYPARAEQHRAPVALHPHARRRHLPPCMGLGIRSAASPPRARPSSPRRASPPLARAGPCRSLPTSPSSAPATG